MNVDDSAVELFLSHLDGDASLDEFWAHPAYDVARDHAEMFGRELTQDDIEGALAGEETAFVRTGNFERNQERIARLLKHVRANEDDWTDRIARHLKRVTHEDDLSDVTVYLGVGYELGIGMETGAYLNLNQPIFFDMPRQLLYTAIHESSHVIYEQEHRARSELDLEADLLAQREMQWDVFNTVFHTEAFATYTPLALRRADGNVAGYDHVICEDYGALSDDSQLRDLVERYDSLRETLREGSVSRETLLGTLFGEHRLPYRVGCAMLDAIEREDGIGEVRDAFYRSPAEFCEEYDWILDEYRTSS
jgi:hypothetical protein